MKQLSLYVVGSILASGLWAQLWYNNGVGVTLTGGVDVMIEGSVENTSTASYTTNHTADIIHVQGDWTNNDAANDATGPGKIVFEGSTPQTMTNNAAGNDYPNVEVNNGGNGLTVAGGDAILSGDLILTDGKVTIGNFNVEAQDVTGYSEAAGDWVVTNGTGMLIMPLSTTNQVYPIGENATTYNPAEIQASAATTDKLGMRVFGDILNNGTAGTSYPTDVVNKTWPIQIWGTRVGYTLTEKVHWRTSEEKTGFDRTQSAIGVHLGGVDNWSKYSCDAAAASAGVGGSTLNWMQDRPSISPSLFASEYATAVGECGHPVPVEWLAFDAKRIDRENVHLTWATASEKDNKGFEVQRRLEGENEFITVGFVRGKGNSVNITEYAFIDDNDFAGLSYYRIKQIDFSGRFEFSDIRVVEGWKSDQQAGLVKGIYNRPNETLIEVNADKVHMRLLTVDAKLLEKGTYSGTIKIDRTHLAKGVYLLHLYTDDGKTWIDRLVIE